MTREERIELVYEIMQFATSNERVSSASTPKHQIFSLIDRIIKGDGKLRCGNKQVLVQELKKYKELWIKVLPLLKNTDSRCLTAGCSHESEDHIVGKCNGKNIDWQAPRPNNYSYTYKPCECTNYTTNAKW